MTAWILVVLDKFVDMFFMQLGLYTITTTRGAVIVDKRKYLESMSAILSNITKIQVVIRKYTTKEDKINGLLTSISYPSNKDLTV